MGSEEWSDPWARQTRTKYKKKISGAVRVQCTCMVILYMYVHVVFNLGFL